MSKVDEDALAAAGPAPEMMVFGKLSTEFVRWKRKVEDTKHANYEASMRYGVTPDNAEDWQALRARFRHDMVQDILRKPLPAPERVATAHVMWKPVTDEGKAIDRLLGQASAGITVLRRSAGDRHVPDFEALRDVLAKIEEHVRVLDRKVTGL